MTPPIDFEKAVKFAKTQLGNEEKHADSDCSWCDLARAYLAALQRAEKAEARAKVLETYTRHTDDCLAAEAEAAPPAVPPQELRQVLTAQLLMWHGGECSPDLTAERLADKIISLTNRLTPPAASHVEALPSAEEVGKMTKRLLSLNICESECGGRCTECPADIVGAGVEMLLTFHRAALRGRP